MKEIDIVVSKTDGLCSFAFGYFEESEMPKLKTFAESLGYTVNVEKTNEPFKDELNPYRKKNVRDINWHNPKNIELVYNMACEGKSDEEIVKALDSDGSGFSITVKRGQIMTEFEMYRRLEGRELSNDQIVKYSKLIANKFMATNYTIERRIEVLKKKGCKIGTTFYGDDCVKNFHNDCLKCPHNEDAGKPIQNEIDIMRFNEIYETYKGENENEKDKTHNKN